MGDLPSWSTPRLRRVVNREGSGVAGSSFFVAHAGDKRVPVRARRAYYTSAFTAWINPRMYPNA
jgi:hypothetical protein